jgi:ABC-type nickel/cobalt efflux system permease component RcnA
MANLSLDEFERCLGLLAEGGAPERLRDKLARLNAFHSRRGMNTLRALTERLYSLSSGLRRDVPAARAFQALWAEHVGKKLNRKSGEKLDQLADKVNENLESDGSVKTGMDAALASAVDEYEEMLARKVGGETARLDTLQKAVPAVATLLRAKALVDVPLDPPEPEDEDEHDHEHHHHHHHGHAHDHEHEEEPGQEEE